jgi:methyl-accepting chemotaxis protein
MRIVTKLILSFSILTAITGVLGASAFWGLHQMDGHSQTLAHEHMPAVTHLLTFKDNLNALKAAERNLMIPRFWAERVQRQYKLIDEAKTRLASALAEYDKLPMTGQERATFDQVKKVWGELDAVVIQSLAMSRDFDSLQMREPLLAARETARARFVQQRWLAALDLGASNLKPIATDAGAGLDSLAQWLAQAKSQNPVLIQARQDLEAPHRQAQDAMRQLNQLLAAGGEPEALRAQASRIVVQQAQPAVQAVLAIADRIDAQVALAESAYDDLQKMMNRKQQLYPVLEDLLPKLADERTSRAQQAAAASQAGASRVLTAMTVALAVALALAVVMTIVITRQISRPIRAMVERIADIAQGEGDLTRRIELTRRDELGELGTWFNRFVEKVHDTVSKVAGATHEVASAAAQIAASNEQMVQSVQRQGAQVNEVTAAVQQITQSVSDVARQGAQASTSAGDATQCAQEGGQVVQKTVSGIQSIHESVAGGAASVRTLGSRSEQIGRIIEVINDIADQTNLLALNAAIEAARAGEAGRGFAVVADEVRKLADRTTKATDEIASSIQAIQGETAQAVERMEAGSRLVEEGVTRAAQAGKSLEQIVASTQSVCGMIQSIAAAAEEQSAAAEEVSRAMDSIRSETHATEQGTQQAALAASQLSQKAEQLQRLVGQFKVAA